VRAIACKETKTMKPIPCLLDAENNTAIADGTVAAKIVRQQKKHLWQERAGSVVDTVVLHYMSAVNILPKDPYNFKAILEIFIQYGVSAHYLIDRAGALYQLVPEGKKAWHCGGSIMPEPDSRKGVNDFSIGIELMAAPDSGFTEDQYRSLAALCADIETRHGIKKYVGHEDIAGKRAVALGLRDAAKTDPGPLFDWQHFYDLKSNNGNNAGE